MAASGREVAPGRLWEAAGLALFAYIVAYGLGVYTSLQYVAGRHDVRTGAAPTPAEISASLAGSACLVLFALLVSAIAITRLQPFGVTWRDWLGLDSRGGLEGALAAFVAVFTAGLAGWLAVSLLGQTGGGLPTGLEGGTLRQVAVAGLVAGVGEELVVLALPCIVLRCAARHLRPGWILAALVGLVLARMAYHLYQGPSALAHVPWAAAMIWAFYRYGQVWSLVLAHVVFDWVVMGTDALPVAVWVLLAVLPLGGWLLARWRRGRLRRDGPARAHNGEVIPS